MKITITQSEDFIPGTASYLEETDIDSEGHISDTSISNRWVPPVPIVEGASENASDSSVKFTGFVLKRTVNGRYSISFLPISEIKNINININKQIECKSNINSSNGKKDFLLITFIFFVLIVILGDGFLISLVALAIAGFWTLAFPKTYLLKKNSKVEFSAVLHDGRRFVALAEKSIFLKISSELNSLVKKKSFVEKEITVPFIPEKTETPKENKEIINVSLPVSSPLTPPPVIKMEVVLRDVEKEKKIGPLSPILSLRLEQYRRSIRQIVEKSASLSEDIRSSLLDIQQTTEKILENMRDDPQDVPIGDRFLSRYLPAMHQIVDECVLLTERGAQYKEVQEVLDKSAALLARLDETFKKKLRKLMKNNVLNLSVKLETLDKVLKMDGH